MNQKMSAEQAAVEGTLLGEPYKPPDRTGTFDVPSYDDIADLNQLFKRFANTAVANGGDTMIGTYNIAGSLYVNGQPLNPSDAYTLVDRTASFAVAILDVLAQTRYMCSSAVDMTAAMPADGSSLPDGARVTIVQAGKGKVIVTGLNVTGSEKTGGQYSTLEVMWHSGNWWCLSSGSGGGGGTGTPSAPIIAFNGDFTAVTWVPVDDGTSGSTIGYGVLSTPLEIAYRIVAPPKPGDMVTMMIDKVIGGTDVTLEVWAVNLAGRGESSNTLTHTYPAVAATTLTCTPGAGSVSLAWTAVPGATDYAAQWRKAGAPTWSLVADIPKTLSAYAVTELEETAYEFRMFAVIGSSFSPSSNVVTVTPDPVTPPVGPVLSHDADTVGKWTIANYDAQLIYAVTATDGPLPVLSGSKMTVYQAQQQFTVSVRRGTGTPITTTAQCTPYTYPYTGGYYQCDNQTFEQCDGNSGYCPCGTWHESEGSCSGWVCHAGHDVPGYYTIGGGGAGWTPSSNAGATFGSPPSPPPGEWFRVL